MKNKKNLQEMHRLANSIRRSYNCLRHTTDQIHGDSELSAPKRTLMLDIDREGPQTVPALASRRYVSRQITQTQVNELTEAGYLMAKVNPEHKRSSLITLTAKGSKQVRKMIADEDAFIEKLGWMPEIEELKTCQAVLDNIYAKLEAAR